MNIKTLLQDYAAYNLWANNLMADWLLTGIDAFGIDAVEGLKTEVGVGEVEEAHEEGQVFWRRT